MCCLCNYICKWLDIEVFSDRDYIIIDYWLLWLAGDVKEPTHLSERVGDDVPGVVVYLTFHAWAGWVSEIKNELMAAARGAFTSWRSISLNSIVNRHETSCDMCGIEIHIHSMGVLSIVSLLFVNGEQHVCRLDFNLNLRNNFYCALFHSYQKSEVKLKWSIMC